MFFNKLLNFSKRVIIGPILRFIIVNSKLSKKFKFLNTNSKSIGHLCIDVFCFIQEKKKNNLAYKGILLAQDNHVANQSVLKIWEDFPEIIVIKNKILCNLFDYLRTYNNTSHDCSSYAAILKINGKKFEILDIEENQFLSLSKYKDLNYRGVNIFATIFPKVNIKKLIILHARDSLYDYINKNINQSTQNNRNSPIESYTEILKFLVKSGFHVIRIGTFYTNPKNEEKYYMTIPALERHEKDLLELFLVSNCALFLGSSSGALALAQIFCKPIFAINILPYAGWRLATRNSMSIPKLLRHNNKILNLKEIYDNNFHLLENDEDFVKNNIEIIANEAEDCLLDFKNFFECYILNKKSISINLINSNDYIRLLDICPNNCYDYYSKSLLPSNFLRKFSLI